MDYLEKVLKDSIAKLGADTGSFTPNPIDGRNYVPTAEQDAAEQALDKRRAALQEKQFGLDNIQEGSGYLDEALAKKQPGLVNKGMATQNYGERRIQDANTELLGLGKQIKGAANRATPSSGAIWSNPRNWWPWPNGV